MKKLHGYELEHIIGGDSEDPSDQSNGSSGEDILDSFGKISDDDEVVGKGTTRQDARGDPLSRNTL